MPITAVQGTWQTDTGVPVSLGTALVGRTTIAQPSLTA